MPKKLLVLLLLFIAMATVAATIYKWVDENGITHYSAIPPANQKAQKFQTSSPSSAVEAGKPASSPLQRREQGSTNVQKQNSRVENSSADQPEGDGSCQKARKQLELLQQQLPVYRDEEGKLHVKWKYDAYQGNREYLDDATRAAEITHTRQKIESSCSQENNAKDQSLAHKQFIKSEYCAAARADLEAIERPEARTPRREIDEQRRKVHLYCNE